MIRESHKPIRGFFRIAGPLVLGVGVIFLAIGLISFFSAYGSFGSPRYFWCAFVGMPLIVIGAGMVKAGYLGAIVRYQASEIAPVGKDTLNYLADGTAPSVRALSRNVAEGLREGFEPGADAKADAPPPVDCPACDAPNEPDAKFCDQCGGAMPRPEATALECPSCNEPNDIDAKFCDACGTPMRRP